MGELGRYEVPNRYAEGESRYFDGMDGSNSSHGHVLDGLGRLDLSGALDTASDPKPEVPSHGQESTAEGLDKDLDNLQGLA